MNKRKNILKIAIDSPAAAGAGTQAKLIAKHYNLFHLDTGKIYRFIANENLKNKKKLSYKSIEKKIKNLQFKQLRNKKLLSNNGRILVRASGTEPKIRIMCESNNKKIITKCINLVKRSII